MSEQQSAVMSSGFDLSQVMAQANKVKADSEESGSGSKEKLIYPQVGDLKVKLLFNPKSQIVIRKFERHTVGDSKVACLQQYGQDCPICKILSDIENAKGLDLWKNKRTSRGICYAEYISDTYKWDKPDDQPKPGEIVMLMFPWTVYQDLNRIMSNASQNLPKMVASNEGIVINIQRYVQNSQTKYKAEIDAFNMNHKTRETDEEYNNILMSLDDLNEKFVPLALTEAIQAKAREVAEQLSKEYLNPVTPQPSGMGQNLGTMAGSGAPAQSNNNPYYWKDPASGQEYDAINGQWVPRPTTPPSMPPVPPTPPAGSSAGIQNFGGIQSGTAQQTGGGFMNPPVNDQSNQQTTQQNNSGNPACFGQHGSINPNQCLVCFKEAECSACSKK